MSRAHSPREGSLPIPERDVLLAEAIPLLDQIVDLALQIPQPESGP